MGRNCSEPSWEFSDDEGTVVITDEETGEEVEAPQDMMFVV